MKFKTPSKPVVALDYLTDSRIQKNAYSMRCILTMYNGPTYISGSFSRNEEEDQERNYLDGFVNLCLSKALYFIENEKLTLYNFLDIYRASRKSNNPRTRQTIGS